MLIKEKIFTPVKYTVLFSCLTVMVLMAQDFKNGMPLLVIPKFDDHPIYIHALNSSYNYHPSIKFNKVIALKRSLWQEKIKPKFLSGFNFEPEHGPFDYLNAQINTHYMNALIYNIFL